MSGKIGSWCFFCHFISHVCGQENWFPNRSTEDFFVDNHWIPTFSIAQNILHEARNIYFRLMDTNLPAVLKVQASELRLEVPKYPQEAQSKEKKYPSTLVPQNVLNTDKIILCT